jgi:hypothetical protein
VLAKINPKSWVGSHSYDFRDEKVAYICITTEYGPESCWKSAFDYTYKVAWRFPGSEYERDGITRYPHDRQYLTLIPEAEKDEFKVHKDGTYSVAFPWDFGLLEYNGSGQPVYDDREHERRRNGHGGYLYTPASDDPEECPGPDYSLYFCDKCNKFVIPHSDDNGVLVCSGCEPLQALIMSTETAEQIERCRALARWLDNDVKRIQKYVADPHKWEKRHGHLDRFERQLNFLATPHPYDGYKKEGLPNRTYLHREDAFSFYFVRQVFIDGEWKRDYNGGLVCHGPHAKPMGETYGFEKWDHRVSRERIATPEEYHDIHWSIHT